MNYMIVSTTIPDDVLDIIYSHSDLEKALCISVLDFILEHYQYDFSWEMLLTYNVSNIESVARLDKELELHSPIASFRITLQKIINLLIKKENNKNFLMFVESMRETIIKSSVITYYSECVPISETDYMLCVTKDVELFFRVPNPLKSAVECVLVNVPQKLIFVKCSE